MAMSILPSHAPSMRAKAVRLAPASTTAMFIGCPISFAFAIAAAMIGCALSNVIMIVELPIGRSGRFGQQAVRVEHEFGGDALVEFGVTRRRILKTDCLGVDDLGDRQAIVQQREHELAIVAKDGRLAGV